MKRSTPRAPSQRALRVGELVRHALAEILAHGEVHDPEIDGMTITIPEVRMSPDLRLATAYVMPLGAVEPEKAVEVLDRNRRFLRGAVARRVNLQFSPDIRFRIDETFAEGNRIDALLRSPAVRRDLDPDDGNPSVAGDDD